MRRSVTGGECVYWIVLTAFNASFNFILWGTTQAAFIGAAATLGLWVLELILT